jgi:hypothetical protein
VLASQTILLDGKNSQLQRPLEAEKLCSAYMTELCRLLAIVRWKAAQ